MRARTNGPASVPDLTNALVAEWKQVPTAMFQRLVESLPRGVETVIQQRGMPMILELPCKGKGTKTKQTLYKHRVETQTKERGVPQINTQSHNNYHTGRDP